MAEKTAWDFVDCIPDNGQEAQLEVVSVNPGIMVGPNLTRGQFQSGDIIKKFMLGEYPGLGKNQMNLVDVRDVA